MKTFFKTLGLVLFYITIPAVLFALPIYFKIEFQVLYVLLSVYLIQKITSEK
jgi:hypothetical protein